MWESSAQCVLPIADAQGWAENSTAKIEVTINITNGGGLSVTTVRPAGKLWILRDLNLRQVKSRPW